MNFFIGFLGSFLGLIGAIILICTCILLVVRKKIGKNNFHRICSMAKSSKNFAYQEYTRIKDVSGMTKLLEPRIIEDFPDFNKNLLFNLIESNLVKIFNAIENKSTVEIKYDKDLMLLNTYLEDYIQDIKDKCIDISFNEIRFHRHAIKNYEKIDGVATITTSSSLEYYYNNSEKENEYKNVKKQTRYTCKFIFIYDEDKLKTSNEVFTINCPNCGAPLKGLKVSECEYCSSHIEPINLKIWKMSYYKEDFE